MPDEIDLRAIKQLLALAENNIRQAKNLLFDSELSQKAKLLEDSGEKEIIEGIFDGEKMIGPEGKVFPVPANYASKSKLVAGDVLKLTVMPDGAFLFKQIGPVKRKKVVGELVEAAGNDYLVNCGKEQYRILPASATYFKAKRGDKLTLLVPDDEPSLWAAVENLIVTN